jgi:8-oxo-dGTP pyrophosphatase MutT (NUDIX family)
VTREHPRTGADELLVFDVVEEPEFTGVVPGGGIEPGETVEDAVVREVREETGLEVRLIRELGELEQPGRRDPDFRHESHFVHAVPAGPTEDEWEHFIEENEIEQGLVRCRWVPIVAGMSVHGRNRGAFLDALLRKRVVAYVTRGRKLLVFDYEGGTELPAGRIDAHESLEQGLVREVEEETGVAPVTIVGELADAAEFERLYGRGAHESHAFHVETGAETPEAWEHHVTGSGMDAGIVYSCRWVPLDQCPPLWGKVDPLVERLRLSITEE